MGYKKSICFNNLFLVLVLINVCVTIIEVGAQTLEPERKIQTSPRPIQSRQLNPTQRPIAVNNTSNVGVAVSTAKPAQGGSIVVEIQTPATTPSNVISVIEAKPSDPVGPTQRPIQTTARPIQTTARPIQTTARPIQTTARPIQTTARPIQTTARPIQTTARPIQTTARPIQTTRPGNANASISLGTTSRPGTTVPIPTCPLVNIMAIKTGFFPIFNDPCAYVSCIRYDVTLFCAVIKCDPGYAFSTANNRCLQSNQCVLRPK